MQLQSGTLLQGGKYKIERVLGQGGFGITYLATMKVQISGPLGTINGETRVAMKEFFMKGYCNRENTTSLVSVASSDNREMVDRFRTKFVKEANHISKLQHPHIIKVVDVFEENDTFYYVMEYVEGSSLEELIKSRGALPEEEALGYIRQIASALNYLHQRRINHLDVKPANILFKPGSGVLLIDFGLAKQYDANGGQTSSTPVGVSVGYAPIEQSSPGGVDRFSASTDIYSLGATLFKLVTGITPPSASAVIEEGLSDLLSGISPKLGEAIEKAMEPSRKKRPQSINEFLILLDMKLFPDTDREYNPEKSSDLLGISFALCSGKKILIYHNGYSYYLDTTRESLFRTPFDTAYLKSVSAPCKIKSLSDFLSESKVFLGGCERAIFAYSTEKYDLPDYIRFIEPLKSIVPVESFEQSQLAALGYYVYDKPDLLFSYYVDDESEYYNMSVHSEQDCYVSEGSEQDYFNECILVGHEYCVANAGGGVVEINDTGLLCNGPEELEKRNPCLEKINKIVIDEKNDLVIKGLIAEIGVLQGRLQNILLLCSFSSGIDLIHEQHGSTIQEETLLISGTTQPFRSSVHADNKIVRLNEFTTIPTKVSEKIKVSTELLILVISTGSLQSRREKKYEFQLGDYFNEIPSEVEITIEVNRCDDVSVHLKSGKESKNIPLRDLIQ